MAILLLEDGTLDGEGEAIALRAAPEAIARELAPLGIRLKHYDPGTSLLFPDLLAQDMLAEPEKHQILEIHDSLFKCLKQEGGYLWSDLLVLHPGSPNLAMLVATYSRYHTHTAAEALYLLAGEAIFGFLRPNGSQVQLLLQAQDYLHIPAGVEHWFSPAASLHCKAVRYFTTVEGWVPQYTGTQWRDYLGKLR